MDMRYKLLLIQAHDLLEELYDMAILKGRTKQLDRLIEMAKRRIERRGGKAWT